jgi:hypothetical protein
MKFRKRSLKKGQGVPWHFKKKNVKPFRYLKEFLIQKMRPLRWDRL